MLTENDFMIQRYVRGNWPAIRGYEPFIVTGPSFKRWVMPGSLELFPEYRFVPELLMILSTMDSGGPDLARESIAEFLLSEGICKAIWAVNVQTVVPESLRWRASIEQLSEEIPKASPVSEWTIELLSGLSDESYYRNYLSESGIVLETIIPPPVI